MQVRSTPDWLAILGSNCKNCQKSTFYDYNKKKGWKIQKIVFGINYLQFASFMHWRRKWQPTPAFLPGESQGQGAWWAAVYGVAQSRTRLK